MKKLSIIIPCNDSQEIVKTFLPEILARISERSNVEVVFTDAFERRELRDYVQNRGCKYAFANRASRAGQCNFGASVSQADFLFFLHIDSIPPQGFDRLILDAFRQNNESGCFRLKFDIQSRFLSSFAWFTQFKWAIARGGDQGLFVTRKCFDSVGKYSNDQQIMEDVHICRKLLRRRAFYISSKEIITSARKYRRVGIFKLQSLFTIISVMYWLGFSNEALFGFYKKYIG